MRGERVSIQLIAPASGASSDDVWKQSTEDVVRCFHSTDCPSEWGPHGSYQLQERAVLCVSIQLIAPASGASPDDHRLSKAILDRFPFN